MSGGVVIGPQEQLLSKILFFLEWSKKCLGRSRMVPGVPQTPLKIIHVPENLMFLNMFLLMPIVFPIVLPIVLPIVFPIVLPIAIH